MGQGVCTLTLVLGVAGFLCFEEEVGSEQECFQPPSNLDNKILFPSPQIFVLCLYMAAGGRTPGCPVPI